MPGQGDGLVSEATFADAFRASFDISAQLTGLRSLAISAQETEPANAAASGLYGVCRKHPSLHWLLRTDGAYVKLAVATLPFVFVKAKLAAEEMRARRAEDVTPSPTPETAADSA